MNINRVESLSSRMLAFSISFSMLIVELFFICLKSEKNNPNGNSLLVLLFGFLLFNIGAYLFTFLLISIPTRLLLVGEDKVGMVFIKVICSIVLSYCFYFLACRGILKSGKQTVVWSLISIIPSALAITIPCPWKKWVNKTSSGRTKGLRS